jgi:uncharacterized protein (DUF305 family)
VLRARFKKSLTFFVRPRRALAVAIVALFAAGCSGGNGGDAAQSTAETGPNVVQPGAPGETVRELSPDELETIETPTHTEADVTFMQDMILHHRQALTMTALVPERTKRKDIPLFAERIEISQTDEIKRMEGWLEARGEQPLPYDADAEHGGHLPGMLSRRQLRVLEQASGRAFDLAFLRAMRRHHAGAIAMVEELQTDGGGIEPEISNFTIHVVADQGIEISRIATLLAEIEHG